MFVAVKCGLLWKAVDVFCIRFVPNPVPWTNASNHCAEMGGDLLQPANQKLRSSLRDLMFFQGRRQ